MAPVTALTSHDNVALTSAVRDVPPETGPEIPVSDSLHARTRVRALSPRPERIALCFSGRSFWKSDRLRVTRFLSESRDIRPSVRDSSTVHSTYQTHRIAITMTARASTGPPSRSYSLLAYLSFVVSSDTSLFRRSDVSDVSDEATSRTPVAR
jgi:hypothetical protein